MTCPPVPQDLTVVITLLAFMDGLIVGNRLAPRDLPAPPG